MQHHRRLLLLLAVISLFAAACGSGARDASADTGEPDGAITTQDTTLGTVIAGSDGLTLYGFTDDADGESTCYDACATTWPPVPGGQAVADDLDGDLFTTVARDDGTDQLKVGDVPLYTFAGDAAAGDVNGQGSGGVWFAVSPDGTLFDGEQVGAAAGEGGTTTGDGSGDSPAAAAGPDGELYR